LHFWHFVFYFTYPNLSKNYGIFFSVLLERLEILSTISGNSKSSFKPNIHMWNIIFSKFCGLLFVFFYYFWHFIFSFVYLYLLTNSRNFYVFYFILWNRDFIKEFWKIMEYFSKKYRHLKSKILYKFHRLLLVFFIFFSILVIFFSYFTYPNLSKNSKHFCGVLLYGL